MGMAPDRKLDNTPSSRVLVQNVDPSPTFTSMFSPARPACSAKMLAASTKPLVEPVVCSSIVVFWTPALRISAFASSRSRLRWGGRSDA